jgi:hypothetical protein
MDGVRVGTDARHSPKSVTISYATANDNGICGFEVYTDGAVTLTSLTAKGNLDSGAYFGTYAGSSVTLGGANTFSKNTLSGLIINSDGNISVSNVLAEENGKTGLSLWADGGAIAISKVTAQYNDSTGIYAETKGAVTVNYALSVMNAFGAGTDGDGLAVDSRALVTIKNSTFIANEGNGIDISQGPAGPMPAPVLTAVNYYGNDTDGSGDDNLYIH